MPMGIFKHYRGLDGPSASNNSNSNNNDDYDEKDSDA